MPPFRRFTAHLEMQPTICGTWEQVARRIEDDLNAIWTRVVIVRVKGYYFEIGYQPLKMKIEVIMPYGGHPREVFRGNLLWTPKRDFIRIMTFLIDVNN